MSPLDHEEGPPVLVLKLAFQFLQWNDFTAEPEETILNNVDLVSKKWRRLRYYTKMTWGVNYASIRSRAMMNSFLYGIGMDELQPKLKGQNL